jgi:hypothetical protein
MNMHTMMMYYIYTFKIKSAYTLRKCYKYTFIDSPLGILSLNWTLNDTDIDLSCAKYEGMLLGTHTLQIKDFQSDDSGRYTCIAATAMGTSQSEEIEIGTSQSEEIEMTTSESE